MNNVYGNVFQCLGGGGGEEGLLVSCHDLIRESVLDDQRSTRVLQFNY